MPADFVQFLNARQVTLALQSDNVERAEIFARATIGSSNRTGNKAIRSQMFSLLNRLRHSRRFA